MRVDEQRAVAEGAGDVPARGPTRHVSQPLPRIRREIKRPYVSQDLPARPRRPRIPAPEKKQLAAHDGGSGAQTRRRAREIVVGRNGLDTGNEKQ